MPTEREAVDALTRVLVRCCRALADAGEPGTAGRLAADGWVVLRGAHPRQAQHLDGAMHYIARLEARLDRRGELTRKEGIMPTAEHVLDVRTEIPKRRHELIFEAFAGLRPGSAYVLVNDHDPKPLRYQLEAEHPREFSWEYLEEGPAVWRVRIGRSSASDNADTSGVWPDWRTTAEFSSDGPGVTVLHESTELKVVLVALDAGQGLPAHPGPAASFHILDGTGTVRVDDDEIAVAAGATVIAPTGSRRAVRADTPLVFLGNLGDPGSESGPA